MRKIINQRKLSLQQIREASNICIFRNCSVCCIICFWRRRRRRRRRIGAGEVLVSDITICAYSACVLGKGAGVAVRHSASIAYARANSKIRV
jgi:hypothetical protein